MLGRRSVAEFREDQCLQLAGSVAFHVLLSVFPLIIVVVSAFGLISDNRTARHTVVDTLTTYIPLSESGRTSVLRLLADLQGSSSALGLLGLIGVAISAGGMMGSLRRALTAAWDAEKRRPFLRGKAMDLLLVLCAGIVLGASFGLTVAVRLATGAGRSDWLAFLGPFSGIAGVVIGTLVPMLLTFALFSFAYNFLPAVRTRLRGVWPGALVGAVLFQILKELFAVYLTHFANYNAVYGSLGVAAAFVFFVYLSANVLLFGAEIASEYPRLPTVAASARSGETPATGRPPR